ncbi:TauD/TfdA family dioxygenase [Allohahella marinimesophila]|uniref:TauD/TfdA family dioxygenase n=1 Tax=Allohahella marinimesophila TaxID=1054972 RepID=UPI0031D105B0
MSTVINSLDQLDIDERHDFITIFRPRQACDMASLLTILQENRELLRDKIARRGVLLFRGFAPAHTDDLYDLVTKGMALDPWNAFNLKNTPGFATSWLRKYMEGLLGGGDYRRYLDKDAVQLGPVESAVQGPHVEGGIRSQRSRYIALCCFEPSPSRAETGMVDLHQVYTNLPLAVQKKYSGAWNRFYYISRRKVHALDRVLLKQSPFELIERVDGRAHLALPPCPAVCAVPETGALCIQPWAFARNTNGAVHAAAVAAFPGRGDIRPDSTAEGMDLTWELCDERGNSIEWTPEEQTRLFHDIFARAHLMAWQKGDIAFVDNIRIGHWRMNGEQGERKLVQIQATAFDADLHHPAYLKRTGVLARV